jgi:hypothetical protein
MVPTHDPRRIGKVLSVEVTFDVRVFLESDTRVQLGLILKFSHVGCRPIGRPGSAENDETTVQNRRSIKACTFDDR